MSKSKTTQTQKVEATNPAWVTDSLQNFNSGVGKIAASDPAARVSPVSALQQQAFTGAAGLNPAGLNTGAYSGLFDSASSVLQRLSSATTDKVTGQQYQDEIGAYQSPYTSGLVDATLADFDVDAGRKRAALAARGAAGNAFGGDRWALAGTELEGELSRARTTADAGLRQSALDAASGLWQTASQGNQQAQAGDLNRQLGAGNGLTAAASAAATAEANRAAAERANLELQLSAGGVERGIDTENRNADIGLMGQVGALLGQNQLNLFNGQTQTGTTRTDPGLMGYLGQAAQMAATVAPMMALSDRRVKVAVEPLTKDDRGRQWYSYRYVGEPEDGPVHFGVMADEIVKSDPHAVHMTAGGVMMVDYGALEGA